MRQKTTKNPSEPGEIRPKWTYKLYVRNDETNGELVESLITINGNEFLNKDVSNFDEEELAHSLIKGDYYICAKRLVKFCYVIPYSKIVVCDLAMLSEKDDKLHHPNNFGAVNANAVDLDNPEQVATGDKRLQTVKQKIDKAQFVKGKINV